MFSEQKIRACLFYLSVAIFLGGLPFILSFALGYKFNPHTFKFTKTGIISLKTQPDGANIYLDGKLMNYKTPATINELLPGTYSLTLQLKEHYPWAAQVYVEPRKVARLEKIILFPIRSHIKKLNQERVSLFWLDKEDNRIYYFKQGENVLYASGLEGERFTEIGSLPAAFLFPLKELKVSPDKEKILVFNAHQICVFYLKPPPGMPYFKPPVIVDEPDRQINNVFWYSDSYHFIVVADSNIEVFETQDKSEPLNLVSLNEKISRVFYDTEKDALYLIDAQKAADGLFYDNVYKLDLNNKSRLLGKDYKDYLIKHNKNASK